VIPTLPGRRLAFAGEQLLLQQAGEPVRVFGGGPAAASGRREVQLDAGEHPGAIDGLRLADSWLERAGGGDRGHQGLPAVAVALGRAAPESRDRWPRARRRR